MFTGYSRDNGNKSNEEEYFNSRASKETTIIARDVTYDTNIPQDATNSSLPVSIGGLGANLSLINFALFSVQVNVSQGGDSQSISVNGGTQNQTNEI